MYNTKQDLRLHGGANPPIVPNETSDTPKKTPVSVSKKSSIFPVGASVSPPKGLIPVTKSLVKPPLVTTVRGKSPRITSFWNNLRSHARKEGRSKVAVNSNTYTNKPSAVNRKSWWLRQSRKVSGTTKKHYKTRRPRRRRSKTRRPRGRRTKIKRSKTRRSKVRG